MTYTVKSKKKKTANYSVTIENLHNLVHSDVRECSLFILFWRGGWLHHGGKKSLRSFLAAGGGHEGFFMSLDRNLNAYFISKFDWNTIKQPFYIKQNYQVSNPRYQIFWRTRTIFFFFRVNLQLLKLQLPLHRDRGGGGAGRAVALPLLLLGFII